MDLVVIRLIAAQLGQLINTSFLRRLASQRPPSRSSRGTDNLPDFMTQYVKPLYPPIYSIPHEHFVRSCSLSSSSVGHCLHFLKGICSILISFNNKRLVRSPKLRNSSRQSPGWNEFLRGFEGFSWKWLSFWIASPTIPQGTPRNDACTRNGCIHCSDVFREQILCKWIPWLLD